ncbi:tyrosine phosphatase family protein [Methylobacterium indicum]|uniref:Protein-tyrosine-phosphatase n=1 Tax=Methylobacterium indicum TaxID=1775910 RepID=A0A8H8WYP2_9HYPH|nr:protein-tyrosine phosphatase family protein [Methylobacterium indicum]BCM86382.1 protein-tyrosine-phosphatase [Methylobacterium indicum]
MPTLHVCPLSRLPETVDATGARHVVTLINVGTPVIRPPSIAEADHLFVGVSDITDALDGHVLPDEAHVRRLLDFVRAWDRARPLVIHCYAGISRSTAAAFIATCALRPDRDEAEIARELRAASPSATPNRRLVAVADAMLGRDGRMVAAIAAIGRGADAFEGEPFSVTIE